jgi:hypothetical protein
MCTSIASQQRAVLDPSARPPDGWEELIARRSGGTLVRLYWHPTGDDVLVRVSDEQTKEDFFVELPARHAFTARYQPDALRPLNRSKRGDGGALAASDRTNLLAGRGRISLR